MRRPLRVIEEETVSTGRKPVPRNVIAAAMLPFRRYARYTGRSSRLEFWSYTIAANVLQIVLAAMAIPVSWILSSVLISPSLAVLVRRLHDVNRSGWWALPLPVLSFSLLILYGSTGLMLGDQAGKKIIIAIGVNLLAILMLGATLLVWTCRRGTPGPNRFGMPPETTADRAAHPAENRRSPPS